MNLPRLRIVYKTNNYYFEPSLLTESFILENICICNGMGHGGEG